MPKNKARKRITKVSVRSVPFSDKALKINLKQKNKNTNRIRGRMPFFHIVLKNSLRSISSSNW